jgi:glyoxylase-like metal-dependent hydrolase (beta-lactamase superfamily II)
MRTILLTGCIFALGAAAQDAKTVIANTSRTMGVDNLTSITYTGSASNVNFGQAPSANGPWQGNLITNYVRSMTFGATIASRATGTQLTPPIQGGPPAPQPFNQTITSDAPWAQAMEIYLTPWGFLKGAVALENVKSDKTALGYLVSYSPKQKAPSGASYKVTALINSQTGMIDSVSTAVEHTVWGDLPVETSYGDYRDFNGTKVPMKIVQRRGGDIVFDANIIGAEPNPSDIQPLMAATPAPAKPPAAAAPALASEKLAEGVYRITGGYVSLAVEFKDYVMVLEGGQSEARGLAVIAETKRLFPAKPIRYLFNTHYHFDHTSGVAPFIAEGATIITQRNNVAYLTRAFSGPRGLLGDVLAKFSKKPKFQAVDEKDSISDGVRTIEFHHVVNMNHTNGMLIAFLPQEKILFQGDFTLPAASQQANEFVMALGDNLKRLNLNYERYVAVHPPNPDVPQMRADVERAIAR